MPPRQPPCHHFSHPKSDHLLANVTATGDTSRDKTIIAVAVKADASDFIAPQQGPHRRGRFNAARPWLAVFQTMLRSLASVDRADPYSDGADRNRITVDDMRLARNLNRPSVSWIGQHQNGAEENNVLEDQSVVSTKFRFPTA
ncbi:hypothetical protein NIM86_16765 [Notoacmeibacter sp. MSK16QG-6]|nr:hypothetical protein [Notoacmeibacter sp. MSK16QG-6]MCP1201067.1 hypothetical protein [Notoacmeibacter sp. MSK16QG-6]